MITSLSRSTLILATLLASASASAQQAATSPSEGGAAPNWDVLIRGRTHTPTPTTAAITAADLKTRLYIFADDSMQGRVLSSAGNVKGVEYIASELKRIGLEPAGENGTYFQTINLVDRKYDPATRLAVGTTTFTPWTDFALRDQGSGARSLDGVQAIFGGTWGDSSSLIDPSVTAGKLVVLSVNPNGVTQNSGGGVNRGSDPKLRDEYVAIGAHNDHIGWSTRSVAHDSIYVINHLFRTGGADDRPPQLDAAQQTQVNALIADIRKRSNGASARPDSIYNGADDDGSGSVSALEIAQYFATQKVKPKRSLLFVWHVGEEAGLYGSEWYTDHPTVPRESIVAQLNMDMVGRGSATDNTGITKEGVRYRGNHG